MMGKADFTQEEWDLILEGPPSVGPSRKRVRDPLPVRSKIVPGSGPGACHLSFARLSISWVPFVQYATPSRKEGT